MGTCEMNVSQKLSDYVDQFNVSRFLDSQWFYEVQNYDFTLVYQVDRLTHKVIYKSAFSNEMLIKDSMVYDRFRDTVQKIFSHDYLYEHEHKHEPL